MLVVVTAAVCSCSPADRAENRTAGRRAVNVAAASDLKFALEDLNAAFSRAHPDVDLQVTYGSSGNFYAQIANGAPFDVYFSADVSYPQQLVDNRLADGSSLFIYAVGRIVVWVPKDSHIDVERLGITALEDPLVQKIAVANPDHAPYGRAAVAAMRSLGVYDAVKGKLVYGENISQTAQFVESRAADVGIIALALALSPALQESGKYWTIPANAHPQLDQAAVLVAGAKNAPTAREYLDYVQSAEGAEILQRFGFTRNP